MPDVKKLIPFHYLACQLFGLIVYKEYLPRLTIAGLLGI